MTDHPVAAGDAAASPATFCSHHLTDHPFSLNECTCCGRYMAEMSLCADCQETPGHNTPVTVDLVMEILHEDDEPRYPRPYGMTMSSLGGCRRRGAYLDAGVDYTDLPPNHPASTGGRWYHRGFLPALQRANPGSLIEHPVQWEPWPGAAPIKGTVDFTTQGLVADLKTMSDWKMERTLNRGPDRGQWWQVHGYAEALTQDGHPVDTVQIIALERQMRENETSVPAAVFTDRHPTDDLDDMVAWVRQVRQWAETDPEQAPRDEPGPGLSIVCDGCEFLTRCWGPDAHPGQVGPQADPENAEAVESALAMYADARDRAKDAEVEKAFARAIIEGAEKNTYGEYALSWRRGYWRAPQLDEATAVTMLEFVGEDPPYKDRVWVPPSPIVKRTRTPRADKP